MAYAENTAVSEERSRIEMERVLMRFGAEGFLYAVEGLRAKVAFKYRALAIRFLVNLPGPKDVDVTPRGRVRKGQALQEAIVKERRRRWRSLLLAVKAKIVAVTDGVETFEAAFLPYIVWGDGLTIGEHVLPKVEAGRGLPAGEPALLTCGPGKDEDLDPETRP